MKKASKLIKKSPLPQASRSRTYSARALLPFDRRGEGQNADTSPEFIAAPVVVRRFPHVRVSNVYDTYWRFAFERQEIFFKRLRGERQPWTHDPVLGSYKFTNAYRVSDRTSQYLIRRVIYRDDLPRSSSEVFFRILLFKLFNKIETWEILEHSFGPITFEDYCFSSYDKRLAQAMHDGHRIYSAAYIMPPGKRTYGCTNKHQNHLQLLEQMMANELPQQLEESDTMKDGFRRLRAYPTIGDFLAYQFITDINYSEITDYSEMEFVVPGPGAREGLHKCFDDAGGFDEPDLIRMLTDLQEEEFERLGFNFQSLWGRRLQLIDCQNLCCELDKYARVAHPEVTGRTGRKRIKQRFEPTMSSLELFYPPKWNLNRKMNAVLKTAEA